MKKRTKERTCADKDCQNVFTPFLSTQKYCSYNCTRKNKKDAGEVRKTKIKRSRIKRISEKQSRKNQEYSRIRKEFFKDPINRSCRVHGNCMATEIHHKMGREGYADQWAKENGISLLVDTRFFLPVCRSAHEQIENNPEWAYSMGYSVRRSNRV